MVFTFFVIKVPVMVTVPEPVLFGSGSRPWRLYMWVHIFVQRLRFVAILFVGIVHGNPSSSSSSSGPVRIFIFNLYRTYISNDQMTTVLWWNGGKKSEGVGGERNTCVSYSDRIRWI